MPKKPPKGAFFFFLMDYKKRCEQNGERFPDGLKNEYLKENAGAEWKVGQIQQETEFVLIMMEV